MSLSIPVVDIETRPVAIENIWIAVTSGTQSPSGCRVFFDDSREYVVDDQFVADTIALTTTPQRLIDLIVASVTTLGGVAKLWSEIKSAFPSGFYVPSQAYDIVVWNYNGDIAPTQSASHTYASGKAFHLGRGVPEYIDKSTGNSDIVAALNSLTPYIDGLEGLLGDIKTYTDGLEALIISTNALLTTSNTYTDGLETLITTLNGYVDGLETLITSTNSLITTLIGYVDGLETLLADDIVQVSAETTQGATTAITAGMRIGSLTALTNAVLANGKSGTITKIQLFTDKKSITPRIRIHFFNASDPTLNAEFSTMKLLYTELAKYLGYIDMPALFTPADSTNSTLSYSEIVGMLFDFQAAAGTTSIWFLLEDIDAFTATNGEKYTPVVTIARKHA